MKSLPEPERQWRPAAAAAAAAAAGVVLVLLPWVAVAAGAPVGDSDPGQASPATLTLNIQTNKLASLVDERFLSLSVDPEQLLRHSQPGPGALRLLSMASALSPAYLRVAGPNTELIGFEGSPAHVGGTIKVSDEQWSQLQSLCGGAGLQAIIGLSARRRPGGSPHWDSRDAMRILAAVDASSVAPAGWQLGYDWATLRRAGISPSQAAKDVKVLRSLIEEFPTLAKEAHILLGPDADPTVSDAEAESEFTKGANIGAAIIRPFTPEDPTGSRLDRDFVTKVLGRNPKRPLWIAESGEQCTAPFSSGLLWAQRLSTATRLGAQVILREMDLDASRNTATSDLWVSLLHKTLTSRGVLDMRGNGPEAGDLSMSAYCTPSSKDNVSPKTQPISPAYRYNLGAVTVMAANPSNRPLRLSLKIAAATGIGSSLGAPEDGATVVHEYILTAPGNDLNSTQTLLNGYPLEMAPGGGIPKLSPRHLQLDSNVNVLLPPRSIAFWVLPGAKAKACQASPASSDVAPAASRLRPISARDMEIGVHLDDDMPLAADPEPKERETPRQAEDTAAADSSEATAKDNRRGRHRLSDRLSGSSRLSLPRMTPPRRPSFDFNFGRSSRDQEIKTLDDFIREELRSRPRSRSAEPPKLPSLSSPLGSFDLPNMPAISGLLPSIPDLSKPLELPSLQSTLASPLPMPNGGPLQVPNMLSIPQMSLPTAISRPLELPTIGSIPTLGQLDTSALLDPLNMNADLLKLNSDIQHGLVQQATTPLRSLVKITDGLLDRIEGSPNANRAKRSADFDVDEEYRRAGVELDDRLRYRRKSTKDLKTDDLSGNQHQTGDYTFPAPTGDDELEMHRPSAAVESSSRPWWGSPRYRRFVPEDIGLRLKRKPAIPDFLSLPRAPKKPLLPTPSAKRAHLLLSQNEDGVPNAWGPAHQDMFPQGDVYAGSEDAPDARNPDVDYVSDDDYLPTSPTSSPKQHGSGRDELYLAPAAIYESTMAQRRVPPRASTRTGEIGELEYFPGKTSPRVDDAAADSFKVVPAARLSKEQQAEIQSNLQKRLEEHYTEVQKAALDKKAQAESEEDVPEEIDEDSLRALAERYRKEKKLNLPEGVAGSSNGLLKQADTKETGKTRTRRDLGERLSGIHSLHPTSDTSAKEGSESGRRLRRGSSASDPSHRTPEEMRERRMEKVKTMRERLARSGSNHPQLPHRGHDRTGSSRPKRSTPYEPSSVEKALKEIQKQIEKDGIDLIPWDSTGTDKDHPKVPQANKEDQTPLARNRGMYGGNRYRPYGSYGSGSYPPMRPSYPTRFGPSHGHGSSYGHRPYGYNKHSDESFEDSEEWHSGYYPHRQRFPRPRSGSDSDSKLDLPEDVNIEDYSMEERTLRSKEPVPKIVPNVVTVPWEISRPTNVRFKRYADNSLLQPKPEPGSPADITSAVRTLHKVLNEDSGSSEEKSAEVNHGGRLIDSSESVDGLEDLIQSLMNMTRHLNDTINEAKNDEMFSWKEFGLDDAKPADPQLDSEEMKYRDAAVAWIQAAKNGDMIKSSKENGSTDQQTHSVKQRPGVGDENGGKGSAHQQTLTEQANIVTAMMDRFSVLLSDLRTMLNRKEVSPTVSSSSTTVP